MITTKVTVSIDTTNEREGKGGKGKELILPLYMLAIILARCIPITSPTKLDLRSNQDVRRYNLKIPNRETFPLDPSG